MKSVQDLERLVARAALGNAGPRDLVGLKQSIAVVPRVRLMLEACEAPLTRSLISALDDLIDVRDDIDRSLIDDPGALVRDGGYIRDGLDAELDDLRRISRSGKQVIAELEERERARTGINSLKVRYNRVFGYYIEISKSNLHAVPADYHRKQTIAGGERFITPALKEYEEKVLGADERILEREVELFEQLRARVAAESTRIQETARALAALDVLGRARRNRGAVQLHQAARARRRRDVGRRRPPSGRRAPLQRRVRAERHDARRHGEPARDPHRPEHGRQVHLPPSDGADLPDGAGGIVRAGDAGENRHRRSHLRARRRIGQHHARPIDLHGRDAGDREHPARRDVAQPRRARRDRPRHGDVRRPEHRVGGGGVSRDEPARPSQDAVSRPTTTS